jgi:hypothetical protein
MGTIEQLYSCLGVYPNSERYFPTFSCRKDSFLSSTQDGHLNSELVDLEIFLKYVS